VGTLVHPHISSVFNILVNQPTTRIERQSGEKRVLLLVVRSMMNLFISSL